MAIRQSSPDNDSDHDSWHSGTSGHFGFLRSKPPPSIFVPGLEPYHESVGRRGTGIGKQIRVRRRDNEVIYALNARTGDLRWRYQTGEQIDPRPLIAGGTLYVGNDASKFYAIDAATGGVIYFSALDGGIVWNPRRTVT